MIFTVGFAYGASYDGIDGFSGGTIQNDELKIVKPKNTPKLKCASKSIPSSYDQSEVTVSFSVRELVPNGKIPVVIIDGVSHNKGYGYGIVSSIIESKNFLVQLCLKQTVGGNDARTIFYSDVRIDVSEYIPQQPASQQVTQPPPADPGTRDSDGDGYADNIDECPREYSKSNNGCRVNDDRDGDGVPNDRDDCPDEYGLKSNYGCPYNETSTSPIEPPKVQPPKDSDGDGYPDIRDQCPREYSKSNSGCPVEQQPQISMDFPLDLNIDEPIVILVIILIVIVAVIVVVKSKKNKVSTKNYTSKTNSTSQTSKPTSQASKSTYEEHSYVDDYFRLDKCCSCERKFSRFSMRKTTKDSHPKLPSGEYICGRCNSINKKWERINRGIFRKSTLRNFRERQDYVPLENNPDRINVTTDREFDELINHLEHGAETEEEFIFHERMINESLLLEFSLREQATYSKKEKEYTEQEETTEEKSDKEFEDKKNVGIESAYAVFGLKIGASFKEVKKRKIQLTLEWHPDRNIESERKKLAEKMMKEINKAYDVIEKYEGK